MDTNYEGHEETVEVAGFIAKTFEILNVKFYIIQNQEFARIIYWSPSGTEFIIKDINKFQQVVLPKYFRHNKINSFIRQLNMYGFHKSRKEHSKSVFSHPLFQKNRE
jgi:heat shock transcription factor 1